MGGAREEKRRNANSPDCGLLIMVVFRIMNNLEQSVKTVIMLLHK